MRAFLSLARQRLLSWVNWRVPASATKPCIRRRPWLESLEDRLAPAAVSDAGNPVLNIALGAGESLAIISTGTSYTLSSNQSFVPTSPTNPAAQAAAFGGFGTKSLTLTAAGLAQYSGGINIFDTGVGASVRFNDSGPSAYTNSFTVTLSNASAGSISFNGTSNFGSYSVQASTISGISLTSGSTIAATAGSITLAGNQIDIPATASIAAAGGTVVLAPATPGTAIAVGSGSTAGLLGLTSDELGRISAANLQIGNGASGAITVSANVTLPTATNLQLTSQGDINLGPGSISTAGGALSLMPGAAANVRPVAPGLDASVGAGGLAFAPGSNLAIALNGTTVDTQYDQLNVAGDINLAGVNLVWTGSLAAALGQTFKIVNNQGTHPIRGAFNGLPEGSLLPNFFHSPFSAAISYVGGDGNDVVVKVGLATTTTLSASTATASYGDAVTLTAAVAAGGVPVSGGTVTFRDGDSVLASNVTLDATGRARLVSSSLSALTGVHAITATYSGASQLLTSSGSTLETIAKRAITVAADTLSKPVGTADPPLTFHISDGSLVTGDAFSGALSRTPGETVGIYPIAQGTLTLSANYVLTFSGANLTITSSVAQLAIANLSASTIVAGGTVTFAVVVEDASGAPVPGYTGTVRLSSTDPSGTWNNSALPATYTFVAGDGGAHSFTIALQSAGSRVITVTDQALSSLSATTIPITVNAGAFSQFVIGLPNSGNLVAGNNLAITAHAADRFGNPVTSYSGPTTITAALDPSDAKSNFPLTAVLDSQGAASFLGEIDTAGAYTLSVKTASATSSLALTVKPAPAKSFSLGAPSSATTGNALTFAIEALDPFGNLATGYSGQVHFTSSDPAAQLPGDAVLVNGVGVFNATLNTAGNQTITGVDTVAGNPPVTGTSNVISTRGLVVTSFAPTATGFVVTFSKPVNPAQVALYGLGAPLQDVSLVGASVGNINGTLLFDATNTIATFKATASELEFLNSVTGGTSAPVLPDDAYTVTLLSGSKAHGFADTAGAPLDGSNNAGHANYVTVFSTQYQTSATPVLGIPDFARGPDDAGQINVPNDGAHGIPVTIFNASAVTEVVFTLTYNPALLHVSNASSADATDGLSTLALVGINTIADSTRATAVLHYSSTKTQSGTVILGDIIATVPSSAKSNYKVKELLQLNVNTLNRSAYQGVVANAVHVNAYLGDVSGDGTVGPADINPLFNIAVGQSTGFTPFSQLDPAIIGDVTGDGVLDGGDVAYLKSYLLRFPRPKIPTPPGLSGIVSPQAADPALSLASDGPHSVSVMIDHSYPAGSTGLTDAILALKYDPLTLAVTTADVTPGSLTGSWQLRAVVDQNAGEIGIEVWSDTPIVVDGAGSLITIAFHPIDLDASSSTTVQLLSKVTPQGESFVTALADGLGALALGLGTTQCVITIV